MGRKAVYTVISIKGRWDGKKEDDRWATEQRENKKTGCDMRNRNGGKEKIERGKRADKTGKRTAGRASDGLSWDYGRQDSSRPL